MKPELILSQLKDLSLTAFKAGVPVGMRIESHGRDHGLLNTPIQSYQEFLKWWSQKETAVQKMVDAWPESASAAAHDLSSKTINSLLMEIKERRKQLREAERDAASGDASEAEAVAYRRIVAELKDEIERRNLAWIGDLQRPREISADRERLARAAAREQLAKPELCTGLRDEQREDADRLARLTLEALGEPDASESPDRLTWLSSLIPIAGVGWTLDTRPVVKSVFRASSGEFDLAITSSGDWGIDRDGSPLDGGRATTFKGGARALLVAFNKRRGGQ